MYAEYRNGERVLVQAEEQPVELLTNVAKVSMELDWKFLLWSC